MKNKMRKNALIFYALTFLLICTVPTAMAQEIEIFEPFPELFSRPLGMEYAENEPEKLYVVERGGKIKQFDINDTEQESIVWFDVSDRIEQVGEGGLLGLTLHPDYPSDNRFYINYTIIDEDGQMFTRISKFEAIGGVGDVSSEEILLEFEQPQNNHNGGQLAFGPDGYLYIALGDGGRDSRDNSQETTNIYGNILRIDVTQPEGYQIPHDNPFVGNDEGLDEIYAWGFRNPWRMSFDPVTGYLWVADVGQVSWESIYIVEKGKNYGWPIIEGSHCFPIGSECEKDGLEMPLFEYPWGEEDTGQSITGGYVYRGSDNPSLYGKYIYGDFISGRVWALEVDHEEKEVLSNEELISTGYFIPSFGVDSNGEIYILRFQGDFSRIYRFVPDETNGEPDPPGVVTLLSPENGAVDVSINPLLSWEEQEQGTGYRVQVALDTEFGSLVVDEDVEDTEFEVSGLDYETIYYWRVRASNDAGDGEWSEVWSLTTEEEPVSPPGIVTLLSPEDGAVDVPISPFLSWEEQVQATGYRVQVALDTEFSGLVADEAVEATEFEVSDLDHETDYYWRVSAGNDAGDGEWSEVWSFTTEEKPVTVPDAVQLLSPENSADDVPLDLTFVWSESMGAEQYHLQLSAESNFADLLIDDASLQDTTFAVSNDLEKNTQYYWRVRASNDAGYSDWSEAFMFTTEMSVSINNNQIPDEFTLKQNFPNPFNPVTQIKYALTEPSDVRLTVYNMLGQRVAVLVNERKSAGWHTVTFDASELSSGIYIYQIRAGENVAIRKLTLLK